MGPPYATESGNILEGGLRRGVQGGGGGGRLQRGITVLPAPVALLAPV
jgi:hypothetical protein